MEKDKKKEGSGSTEVRDWQVIVSRSFDVIEMKQMSMDMSKTRLKPIFLSNGDLSIVVPATSDEAAKERASNIARRIASAGVWGMDLLDLTDFNLD
ncbi:MAG TPA: hypothetical protein VLX91_09475 [Candidatus Acidoferrales bacterium]|nr:hypothetical protein [Candidatus Acidoferrales bacterium]